MAVIRLTSGEAKRKKQAMSIKRIFQVLLLFRFIKVIVKPMTPKNANSWSMLPKSTTVNNNQTKNGSPIILPIKIIKR